MKKIFRYLLILFSAYVVLVWSGIKPPKVNFNDIKELQGRYICYVSGGKSPSGEILIDGIHYSARFSYVFGIEGPGSCYREINGQIVKAKYIMADDVRILLEIKLLSNGEIYGHDAGKNVERIKKQLMDDSSIILVKSCFSIILICLVAWGYVRQFFLKILKLSKLGD